VFACLFLCVCHFGRVYIPRETSKHSTKKYFSFLVSQKKNTKKLFLAPDDQQQTPGVGTAADICATCTVPAHRANSARDKWKADSER
jgi:hypothetical protein